jgi:2-phospho-L-lactate guanylyltransferase
MPIQILIGLKRLSMAKQRLMPQLSPVARRDLMIAMLSTVTAAARASQLGPVALATSEPAAASLAVALNVEVVPDRGLPWNEGLVYARDRVVRGASAVLYLAADLPLLVATDLALFADAAPSPGVAVARARDGGSNALLVTPPDALAPMFGHPHSAETHRVASAARGLACRVVNIPGLALDVDTLEDARDAGIIALVTETGPGPGRG